MTKRIPWDLLLDLLGRFPQGASLEEILLGLSPPVPRRTLQRWLAQLIHHQKVIAQGKGRARRYKRVGVLHEKEAPLLMPLSEEGSWIHAEVSRPISIRRPVGYDKDLLESYQPNTTWYLSENVRRELYVSGRSGEEGYPAGTYAHQIFHRLLIDLSWNSSRLEGNAYSLLETEQLFDKGKVAEGKDLRDTQMILNHKAAIEFIVDAAQEIGVNRYTILNLHTLLSDNLLPDPSACGRLRAIPVGIAQSVYQPLAIPQVIEECFDLLLAKASQIRDPFEQAFFLMVHLPYLQPFDDVNKRTSRLAVNIPLIRNNFCPFSFIDIPESAYISGLLGVYEVRRFELLRDVFVWGYQRSCAYYSVLRKVLGEPDPFRIKYRTALQHIVKQIIHKRMDQVAAIAVIRHYTSHEISTQDAPRFIELVERELQSLHEGNIARYQLRPNEYEEWKRIWE